MIIRAIALASALFGIAGTALLFFYSYTIEPTDGAVFGSAEVDASNAAINAANAHRTRMQRIGFALLCISFVAQGVGAFLP